MHYTKLSVAGCAALMFGLIACSGEDGKDGVNGVNGLNGADGASCEVKSLKDESGYKVLCGGDSVGVLLNGKTGATGKQGIAGATGAKGDTGKTGESCKVEPITDGFKVLCGNKEVGTLKNGVNGESCTTSDATDGIRITCGTTSTILKSRSCTVKETATKDGAKGLQMECDDGTSGTVWDGKAGSNGTSCTATTVEKDGKSGITMKCGDTEVGTVWNGDDGVNCVSTDNGDGTVDVKCGDADAVTIFKAMCGDESYDPSKKFCVLGKLYDKCGGSAFTVNTETCINDEVVPLCLEYKKLKNGNYQYVTKRGIKDGEFCWNGIITPKCGGKEFSQHEFCGTAYDGKTDSIWTYCDNAYAAAGSDPASRLNRNTVDGAYYRLGVTLAPRPVEGEDPVPAAEEESFIGNLIGTALEPYSVDDLNSFFTRLEAAKGRCDGIETAKWCGDEMYDAATQFCDIRDDHIYKYAKPAGVEGIWWMNENLAFEYKLPKITTVDEVDAIDQVMGKVNYEAKVFENFEAAEGRYYTWNSAMGVGDIRKTMSADEIATLIKKDQTAGACPAGWRLPTKNELDVLQAAGANLNNENGFIDVGFDFNFVGYYNADDNKVMNAEYAYFWSSDSDENDNKQAYGIVITAMDKSKVSTTNKVYGFTIRCVTNTDPASDGQN